MFRGDEFGEFPWWYWVIAAIHFPVFVWGIIHILPSHGDPVILGVKVTLGLVASLGWPLIDFIVTCVFILVLTKLV